MASPGAPTFDGGGIAIVLVVLAAPFVASLTGIIMMINGMIRRRTRLLQWGAALVIAGGLGIAGLVTYW